MSLQLSADKIRGLLPQAWADIDIDLYEEIDSTNMQARRDLQAGLYRPKLIVAGGQTAGRGRRGKSFYSPKEKGIYMTLVRYRYQRQDFFHAAFEACAGSGKGR